MATIHVDGKEYRGQRSGQPAGACLSLGLDIPFSVTGIRSCWPCSSVCGKATACGAPPLTTKEFCLPPPFAVEGYVELELTAPRRLHLPADLIPPRWQMGRENVLANCQRVFITLHYHQAPLSHAIDFAVITTEIRGAFPVASPTVTVTVLLLFSSPSSAVNVSA